MLYYYAVIAIETACTEHAGGQNKSPLRFLTAGFDDNAGSDLLSHTVSHAVPSAVSGLTSVFGMGTGGTLIL